MKFLTLMLWFIGEALASRSRMYSLNQDPHRGSYYIEDNRNIFRNPADINIYKDYLTLELAFVPSDPTFSLVPQGGYFSQIGQNPFGIFLGQGMAEGVLIPEELFQATPTNFFLSTDDSNPVSFFWGGGDDWQWGMDLRLVNAKKSINGVHAKNQGVSFGMGLNFKDISFYAVISLMEKSSVSGDELDENGTLENNGLIGGMIYKIDSWSFLLDYIIGKSYLNGRADVSQNGKASQSVFSVGIGKKSERYGLFFNLNFEHEKELVANTLTQKNNLPLVVGVEKNIWEWLVMRGSVSQNIFFKSDSYPTKVSLGATLQFGKVSIDGNLGLDEISLINSNMFFANAAITYWH